MDAPKDTAGPEREGEEDREGGRKPDAVERILRMVAEGRITPEEAKLLIDALRERSQASPFAKLPPIDMEGMGRLGRRLADRILEAQAILEREAGRVLDVDKSQVRTWQGAVLEGVLTLDVSLARAGLEIARLADADATAADDGQYRVAYQPGPLGGFASAAPEVLLEGDRLVVRQPPTLSGLVGGFGLAGVTMDRVRILLPNAVTRIRGYVRTQSGRISVSGLSVADLDVESRSGRVALDAPRVERLTVSANSGRVDVSVQHADTVRVQTRNGRIRLAGHVADLAASAANGRIDASPACTEGTALWRLHTRNGSIVVLLPDRSVGVEANLRSANGRVRSRLEGLTLTRVRGSLTGGEWRGTRSRGEGAATFTLDAEATNGGITLAERADDETVRDDPSPVRETWPEDDD